MSKTANSKLIVLSAPSGAGKSTLANKLLDLHSDKLKLSISYTTRSPRGQEKHGTHYFFVNEERFKQMIAEGAFLEYAHVFGKSYYGTARKTVEEFLNQGKSVLFDIDVQGAAQIKKAFKERCVTIFINAPSFEILEKRLRDRRTEDETAIQARLATARSEIAVSHTFDHLIINDSLETSYKNLEAILIKEGCL